MFRDERYKLNVYHDLSSDNAEQQGQLFDMEADPGETVDLWNDPKFLDVKVRLMGRLMDWLARQDYRSTTARSS